jgi:hypothetical protein
MGLIISAAPMKRISTELNRQQHGSEPVRNQRHGWFRMGMRLMVCVSPILFWLVWADPVWAQAGQAPAAPGGSGMVQVMRPLWTEMAITVVMAGLALFAVCRNSNRN